MNCGCRDICKTLDNSIQIVFEQNFIPEQGRFRNTVIVDPLTGGHWMFDSQGTYIFLSNQGPTGASGPIGATGAVGPSGAGVTGATGPQGFTGATGPVGPTGASIRIIGQLNSPSDLPPTGSQGDAYLIGGDLYVWTGSTWDNVGNIQGPQGQTGPIGQTGATGPLGNTGPRGFTGAVGAQGATGAQGNQGTTGPTGPQGTTGAQGATGAGVTGATGAQGIQGVTGAQGTTGPTGATGAASTIPGPTGPAGATGPQGVAGGSTQFVGSWADATSYDLYDNVVHNGSSYSATSAHTSSSTTEPGVGVTWTTVWQLAAERGDIGETGATGPVGFTGPQGATGPQGVTGSVGATGVGATGSQGTTGPTGPVGATGPTGPAGLGDVVGPSGSTDMAIAIFDGTTGKLIKETYTSESPRNVLIGPGPSINGSGTGTPIGLGGNAIRVFDGQVFVEQSPYGESLVVGEGTPQTLINKRIQPRVSSAASGNISPVVTDADIYIRTGLTAACTIAAPTGSPQDGEKLLFRIRDNGTARALTWNATYKPIGITLPTTTTANKWLYVGAIYNAQSTAAWDVIAVTTEA